MNINSHLFEAYLKCPTKCWLRSQGEPGGGNEYAAWVQSQNEIYRSEGVRRLVEAVPPSECVSDSPLVDRLKSANWRFGIDMLAQTQTLESHLHAVERLPSEGRGRPAQFIPIRFVFTNKLSKDDKLLLAFDALVLSEVFGREVRLGRIIHGDDHASLKVKTSTLMSQVRNRVERMHALLSNSSAPELVLNRHCAECDFQMQCRQKAIEKDDLSLLMNVTEKERKKYHGKGIFTITQLSYTFRPRRRPRRLRNRPEKYHHSLKALAIRERRIYVVGSPEFKIEGTPVYLDVEGIPDREVYYLIGVRIRNGESVVQHSMWADSAKDESRIWASFLRFLTAVDNPVLVHYGSYETTFLRRMSERYGGPPESSAATRAIRAAVNLLSVIFARVYFPTFSNGLKDLAGFLGFKWSETSASGLCSLTWRADWEQFHRPELKQRLIAYNADDCEALCQVTTFLSRLYGPEGRESTAAHSTEVVQADSLPDASLFGFGKTRFQFPELDEINRAAYWDYQRERVLVRSNRNIRKSVRGQRILRRTDVRANKVVTWPRPEECPRCEGTVVYKHGSVFKTIFDIRFGKSVVRKWVVTYRLYRYRCPACGCVLHPHADVSRAGKYGPNLRIFSVYLAIELRLPQDGAAAFLNEIFGFHLWRQNIGKFKAATAAIYQQTYERLLQNIVGGQLIQADETTANVEGSNAYIWVFASLEEVVYIYTPSREGDWVQSLLKDFKGVLVSDFYAAYDSLCCPQQKCLVHLIRDMNADLMREPFNEEIKALVRDFGTVLKPIIGTIDRFGLKARYLRRHRAEAEAFFDRLSRCEYRTETAVRCKKRLEKNRSKLFTFLNYDGVPWNNNNAEHAIKAFVMLRRGLGGASSERGMKDYLTLLSVSETCRFKGVNFLDFLRSGVPDIDSFAANVKGRRARVINRLRRGDRGSMAGSTAYVRESECSKGGCI